MSHYAALMDSPIGPLTIVVDDEGRLVRIHFGEEEVHEPDRCNHVIAQLREYFDGTRTTFDVVLDLHGTAFQKTVWNALLDVPYGTTISYGELARRIGRPDAVRAVGTANGANPVPIIVPCHRIIGANGTLTGYGGGLPRKQQLLALESRGTRLF